MNSPRKDYTQTGWLAVTALIAVLVAVSFIPPQTLGSISLRRANILSDLIRFDESSTPSNVSATIDEEDYRVDMKQVAEQIEADSLRPKVQTRFDWTLPAPAPYVRAVIPDSTLLTETLVPIEDFSPDNTIQALCDTMLNARRTVRIAVMGDSFIEGDILTADLRERLQSVYGGGGTGFAPMASPLTAYRRTIRTAARGWDAYGIMQRKSAPAALRENFFVSGWVCRPAAGASTRWENTFFRTRLDTCNTAHVLFVSPSNSRVEVVLNDTLRNEFAISGAPDVRQITVSAPHIHSLTFKVLAGEQNFIGYGAHFESQGVVVDNYSIRSNNGQAMFWTNPSVNVQINAMRQYDLVILQYGLNIMQPGILNYTNYGKQIEKMAAYVRQCFPRAAILVMSVSDRSARTDSGFAPMDAVPGMVAAQRQAAQNAKVAFWSTCDAMRAQGGMTRFVSSGWAGKDYTHINYAGGRRIGWALYDALNIRARMTYEAIRAHTNSQHGPVIDSQKIEHLRNPAHYFRPIHPHSSAPWK